MAEKKPEELKLITMEEIQAEKVEWLLYPFIPYGKVTIIQGDPGEGKTTTTVGSEKRWQNWIKKR